MPAAWLVKGGERRAGEVNFQREAVPQIAVRPDNLWVLGQLERPQQRVFSGLVIFLQSLLPSSPKGGRLGERVRQSGHSSRIESCNILS